MQSCCQKTNSECVQKVLKYVEKWNGKDERRLAERVPRRIKLQICPLDDRLDPGGQPFQATTRDVSEHGMGFLHDRPFPTQYVRIAPNSHSPSYSVGRVCYNTPQPGLGGNFLVGVQLLSEQEVAKLLSEMD